MAACGAALSAAAGLWSWVAAPSAWASTVTLRRGETLSQLAVELHTTVAALVAANHLADPNRVYAGQVLVVPGTSGAPSSNAASGPAPSPAGPTVVVVRRGETLSAIAARFHTTVGALAAANHLSDPNRVLAGSSLVVPSATARSPVPALSAPASPPPASSMQLLAYSVPAPGGGSGAAALPAALRAHPDRLALAPLFAAAAARYGVPRPLLEAMCWWESGWQANVVSKTGAYGICQLEPATAAFVDKYLVSSPLDAKMPAQNIALGAAYLADLLHATGGDVGLALAGYYQGLTYVRVLGMLPDTTNYVRGIEAYTTIFAGAGL
jgi:N-acetylmuramoyl-L-alanine amidase